MPRYRLVLEYEGSSYHGWQDQPNVRTVEGEILASLTKLTGKKLKLTCAGRTDKGVHALCQVVHFDFSEDWSYKAFIYGLNNLLPKNIRILSSEIVPEDFNARFHAVSRTYKYVLYQSKFSSAILTNIATWTHKQISIDRINACLNYLLGEQDFSSFRDSMCQSKTPIKTIYTAKVRQNGNFFIFTFSANAFLHHMIRNIMGCILPIAIGKKEPIWLNEVIKKKNRQFAGVTAPSNGLYLFDVKYDNYELPEYFNTLNIILKD